MEVLTNYVSESTKIRKIITDIGEQKKILVTGLSGSSKTLLVQAVQAAKEQIVLILAPNALQANQWYEDLTGWLPNEQLHLFSADEVVSLEMASQSLEVASERVTAMDFLARGETGIVVASLAGVKRLLPPKESFLESQLHLHVEKEVNIDSLLQQLVDMGYVRDKMVASPGEFSLRGEVLDIYPISDESPVRIGFFDTEVDSIRYFEVETQRSLKNIDSIHILPAHDQIFLREWKEKSLNKFEIYSRKHLESLEDEEVYAASKQLVESIREEWLDEKEAKDIRFYAEWIYPKQATLIDYLPNNALLVVDDYPRLLENEQTMQNEWEQWSEMKMEDGYFFPKHTLGKNLRDVLANQDGARLYLNVFQKGMGHIRLDEVHPLQYRTMIQFYSQMETIQAEVNRWMKHQYAVVIFAPNEDRAYEISEILEKYEVDAVIKGPKDPVKSGIVQIYTQNLRQGFELPDAKLAIITEKELFNRLPKKKPRRLNLSNAERLKSYNDLKPGDYVVHINHGIGRYLGMETMEVGGVHRDYLHLEYNKEAKLYVPVEQIDMVQKYVASEGRAPRIHTLGGTEWNKTKTRVQKQVEDIADDLIELYAEREAAVGYAYEKDNDYQRQFEEAFPYSETEDQLRSSEEIKRDMEKTKPMDRLLVGDVGYGKTEVASRAIFKAIQEGKQAAILVPTTVLAQQHYHSFLERFEGFPIKIGLLSRFRTKKEQDATLDGLKKGSVDILIGTHRILSEDVVFQDLGLLVIDEEQRFGVKHKERIKQMKNEIDVLTLTATPIPRTLHMSMIGVRDLSVLETPPQDRYPVQTYVMEMNTGAITEAIEREMARGGQVFFLHNRVKTIEQRVAEIKELVPDARVAFAHGQMTENRLEDVLLSFVEHEYDVLVTTTIIETGIDMPNVNTLIIEDADHMGLSQLYQLRGRVGRSNRVAYAYLMYQQNKILKEDSEKRLQALRDFTELGAGFKIAMRDLSIRGAGNLLGQQQSGFIDSVGYDLYTELLRKAVARKQNKEVAPRTLAELNFDIDAYLPANYISDEFQKIEMYKRIQRIENFEDYLIIQEDLIDRFGDYPQEVADLLEVSLIKSLAESALIEEIKQVTGRRHYEIVIRFANEASQRFKAPELFKALMDIPVKADVKDRKGQWQVTLFVPIKQASNVWLNYLEKFIQELLASLEEDKVDEKEAKS